MIPEAAVEAAAHALFAKELGRPMEVADEPLYSEDIQACREDARAALEAAAPHMVADLRSYLAREIQSAENADACNDYASGWADGLRAVDKRIAG